MLFIFGGEDSELVSVRIELAIDIPDEGSIVPPTTAGLGYQPDLDFIRGISVRSETFQA